MGLVTSRINLASDFIANSLRQELIVLENCRRAEMRKNIMSLSCLSWLVLHREQLRGRPKADVKSSWVSCTTPPTCNHKIQNDYEFWGNLGFWVLKDAKVTTISNHNLKAWTCLGIFFPNWGWLEFDSILVLRRLPQSLVCFPKVATGPLYNAELTTPPFCNRPLT